jgi:hypothetical protein
MSFTAGPELNLDQYIDDYVVTTLGLSFLNMLTFSSSVSFGWKIGDSEHRSPLNPEGWDWIDSELPRFELKDVPVHRDSDFDECGC